MIESQDSKPLSDLELLHADLVNEGYEVPELEKFKVDMEDEANLEMLHTDLIADGFKIPEVNQFKADMGLKKKETGVPTTPESKTGSPSQSQSVSGNNPEVPKAPEDPIYILLQKRKEALEKKQALKNLSAPIGPAAMPSAPVDTSDVDTEVNSINESIKGRAKTWGFDVKDVDGFFKDVTSLKVTKLSDNNLKELYSLKSSYPQQYNRTVANLRWTDAARSVILSNSNKEEQATQLQELNNLVETISSANTGSGAYNKGLSQTRNALAKIFEFTAGDGDAREIAIESFKADVGPALARELLQDSEAVKRMAENKQDYAMQIALDYESIFDEVRAAQTKDVANTNMTTTPAAQAKERRLADTESFGLDLLASGITNYMEQNEGKFKAANKTFDEGKKQLDNLSAEIKKLQASDDGKASSAASSVAQIQESYSKELKTYTNLKNKIESGKGTKDDEADLAASGELLNGMATKIQSITKYSSNPLLEKKVAEYNAIAEKIKSNAPAFEHQKAIAAWNDYINKRKNTLFTRYPVKAIDAELEDRQNYYGANSGFFKKSIINFAGIGDKITDFADIVYGKLFQTDEENKQDDWERIGREDFLRYNMTYTTESEDIRQRPFVTVYSDEIKAKLDAIKNNDSLSENEKYKQSYSILTDGRKNGQIYYTSNPKAGDYNITAKSSLNAISNIVPQIVTSYALTALTGGAGAASTLRTTSSIFMTTFMQGYSTYHTDAVRLGIANPDSYALTHSMIDAATEVFSIKDFKMFKGVTKELKGVGSEFFKNITEKEFNALVKGSKNTFKDIKRAVKTSVSSNIEENLIEEGTATVLGNIADKQMFAQKTGVFDDFGNTVITGTIGQLPLTALGVPLARRNHNIGNKYQFYVAGQNPSSAIETINNQLENGQISQEEASKRIEVANNMAKVVKAMPKYYADGTPMKDHHKATYAFNQFLIEQAQKGLENLPAEQKEKIKETVTEAENENGQILSGGGFTKPAPELSKIERVTLDAPAIITNTTVETERIKALANDAEDGATLNLDGTTYKGKGLVVPVASMNTTQEELTPDMISKFAQEHQSKLSNSDVFKFGVYKFPNSNKVSIDLNIVTDPKNRDIALEFARKAGQESLFDLNNFENVKTGSDGSKPMSFTDEQFAIIGKSLAEGVVPQVFTDEKFANETIDKAAKGKDIDAKVEKLKNTYESSGIKVEVVDNNEEMNKRLGNTDAQKSYGGLFIDTDGTILLNKQALENSNISDRIIYHEGSHPALNIIRNTNEALYNKAVAGLKAAASKNKEVAASIAWAEKNYNEDGQQTVDDEALVETIAKVGDGTLDISKLPTSLKQDIIDIINKLASAIGLPPVSDTDVEAFRKVATQVSDMLKSGTNVEDVVGKGNATKFQNNIESGLPNGNPMQLRAGGEIASEPVKLKDDGHKLSFVTKDKLFDVIGLIDEIKAKDQKVWFWTADQLGRGFIYDKVIEGEHYLDAGPSFALDPENVKNGVIWASGMNQNQLKNKIADSDYIFIISGSPQNSKLFNKKVSELVKKRIEKSIEGEDKFNTFKTKILEVSKINSKGGLNEILSKYNSFDELFGGQDRKPFLIEINKVAEKKGTPLKSLLEKFNAFVNPNELRDGFFADNNFDLNDVMLVLKPTALGGKSKHSTYENDILGEVVGVPNRKVNAWDIIPEKMKKASATTSSQKAQVIAPYGSRVTKIQARVGDNLIEKAGVEKEMTEDGKGNYIFYHYSDKNIKTIDPEKFGSNTRATGKDEKAGVGISMYYTRPDRIEANVSNDNGYVVRVPMSKVYPFNADPLNLLEKAEKEFRKEYGPDAAFDLNKQVGYVTKIAGKLGYKMTVAEWNIGKKKALRAQTTEAMKPEVYSKIKSGTFNQIEFNPELEGLKANASKKKMQARISAEFSPQDLKNYSKLANFDKYGKPSNVVTLAEIGIDSSITNAKQAADKLAEFEGPFQPIAKAIAKIPKLEKVLFHIDPTSLDMGYGTAVGMYYTLPKVWVWEEEVKAVRVSDVKKNTYMNTIHELLHWVTMDSVMSDKGSPEYTALKSIFNYLETHDKFKDIPRLSRQAEKNYGMFSWNEFLVEIFANSEFRDNISDIFATKEELEKVNLKPSSFTDDWDRYGLGFAIYEYITKLFKKSIPDVTEGIDFDKPLLDNALDLATRLFINRDYGKDKPVTKAEVKKAVQARISNEFSADDLKRYNKLKNYNKYGSRYNQVSLKDLGVDDSVTNAKQFAEKLAEFDGPLKPLAIVISRIPSLDKVYFAKQDGYIPLAHMKVGKASGTFGPMPKTFIWEKEEYILKMGDNQIENNYLVGLHELMHWVTLQSPVVDTKDPDYKALQRIYTFLNTHEKFKDVPSNERFDVRTYGMYNFDEFMVELFTSPHFRENIQDIFATKEDFIEANIDKSTFGDNWDRFGLGYAIYEYVAKLLRKAVPDYAAGIDFDKSILDNALELATRTFINKAVEISASDKKSDSKSSTLGSTSNYKGGSVVDFLESVGMKSDFNSRKELATKNGISNYTGSAQQNTELLSKLKSSKVSTTAQARVEDGEDTGEKNRGLEKTFSQRNSETVARINEDAKTYFQISNKQTTEEVNKFMEGKDVEEVTNYLLTEPNNIAGRVRIWMSGVAMDGLDKKIVEAEKNGDKKAVARLAEKQAQLINQVAPLGTELGQAIQAFRRFYQNNSGSPAMFNHFSNGLISKIEKEANRKLSEEEIEKIKEFAKQIQDAKEGLPKDEATFALGNYVGKIVPVSATDILQSIWYAHILSGVTTQTTNFFANFWNTFAEGAVTGIRESFKSRSLMPMIVGMKGFIDGVKIGASEGADIFLTGITAQDANKFVNKDLLEYFSWKQTKLGKLGGGKVGKFMDKAGSWSPAVLKYVGRALAATDAAFSRSNTEAMSRMMAYTQAKKEGAEDVQKRAREILYNTKENVAEAKAQATEEGYVEGTRKYKRRVYEIMEQKRGAEFNQKAQAYGTKVTLNYEPEGFTRPLYNAAVALQESSKFAKLFIPFTRIIANITENSLNYTPLGFIKAGVGSTNSEGGRRKLTADERADYAIKAAIGVATFITLAGLTGDKEDDLFDITANGAADMQKNYELRKSGWRPYSIKLKNGKYISYKDWPIMPLLAALGAMHDSDKYEKDSPEVSDRAKIALWGLANSVYDKSVMKGIQDFAEILKPKAEYNQSSRIGERLMSWGADQASTMLISNFTKQNIKFVMESMDSPVKAAKGIQRIYKDIPFLNDGLNPIIDVFGEPVTQTTSEKLLPITIGKISKDEMLSVINENGIFIGKPQTRDIFIDDKTGETRPMTDQEYYEFTKKSGQLTKKYLAEDWKDIQEALRIKDPKEKSETLQAIISSIVSDARDEAMEMFYDANGRAIKPTNQNKK